MNAVKVIGTLIVGLVILFIFRIVFLVTPLWAKIQAGSWWPLLIVAGIIVSGYLSFKYASEEKQLESQWIEQEGEAFMEPIRKKRSNKEIIGN